MIESPDIVRRLRRLFDGGGFLALFDRALVPRTRSIELIDMLTASLPEEMEQAKEILDKRDEILEEAKVQAGEIVDEAVKRAEKLVDADAITREAKERAVEVMKESDEYVIERLIGLEDELTRLLDEVRAGLRSLGGKPAKKRDIGDQDD